MFHYYLQCTFYDLLTDTLTYWDFDFDEVWILHGLEVNTMRTGYTSTIHVFGLSSLESVWAGPKIPKYTRIRSSGDSIAEAATTVYHFTAKLFE